MPRYTLGSARLTTAKILKYSLGNCASSANAEAVAIDRIAFDQELLQSARAGTRHMVPVGSMLMASSISSAIHCASP